MEKHINPSMFTDEQLREYQLNVQSYMAELAIYNTDCQNEWDKRYPKATINIYYDQEFLK